MHLVNKSFMLPEATLTRKKDKRFTYWDGKTSGFMCLSFD